MRISNNIIPKVKNNIAQPFTENDLARLVKKVAMDRARAGKRSESLVAGIISAKLNK